METYNGQLKRFAGVLQELDSEVAQVPQPQTFVQKIVQANKTLNKPKVIIQKVPIKTVDLANVGMFLIGIASMLRELKGLRK